MKDLLSIVVAIAMCLDIAGLLTSQFNGDARNLAGLLLVVGFVIIYILNRKV